MTTLRGVHKQTQQSDVAAPQLLEGTVLDPPLTADDWLRVEVDSQQGAVRECPWVPRLDVNPMAGDAAALLESDDGNWWAVGYWPQNGQVPEVPSGSGGATWLSGAGAPDPGLGADGDFYLDTVAHAYYGPKAAGDWGAAVQLIGPAGPQGIQGPQGNVGPQGIQGVAGTPGEKWFTGAGAPAGATGIVGDWYLNSTNGDYYEKTGAAAWTLRGNLKGATGATGQAEAWWSQAGVPANATGAVGDWSLNTTTGDVYEKTAAAVWTLRANIKGPQGAAGAAGAVGPTGYDTSPIGSVITHTSQTIPAEYLLANGQQVNAVDYPQLDTFAAAEVAAGSTLWSRPVVGGVQKVQLPDFRDRFIYGGGAGATKAFGAKAGAETHTLLAAESGVNPNAAMSNPGNHTHPLSLGTTYVAGGSTGFGGSGGGDLNNTATQVGAGGHTHALTARNADSPHNNMPPYCVLAFLVKAKGVSIDSGAIVGPPGPAGRDASVGMILALGG